MFESFSKHVLPVWRSVGEGAKRYAKPALALTLTFGICTGMVTGIGSAASSPASLEDMVNQTLSQLTLRDRCKLMMGGTQGEPGQSTDIGNQTKAAATKGLSYMNMSDGSFGVNINGPETSFGSGLVIASTWDPTLQNQVGQVIGKEALAKNVQVFLGPGINVIRDIAGGRSFEYYSEDPVVVSNTVVPYIKGVQSEGVAVTLKHLMANNQEDNRNFQTSNLSERAMHETYLRGFEAAIKQADVWSLMTGANRMNGIFSSDNRYLLTNVAKYDFGLRGLIMTDWTGTRTGIIAKKAGLDLSMPYSAYSPFQNLENYVRSGQLDEKTVNDSAQRIVRVAALTKSLITTDKVNATGYTAADRKTGELNTTANQAVSRQVADEGIVLLKNQNNLLPLNKSSVGSVAVLGKYANYNLYQAGLGGSAATNPPYQVTNLQGLKNKLGTSVTLNTPTYNEGNMTQTINDAVAAARSSQVAIVYAGINSTAYTDANPIDTEGSDRTDWSFPAAQQQLIQAVTAANPNTIVVLNGSSFDVTGWIDSVPSVVQSFYPGMEGGNSIANILFGDVNPSGKLTFTWPKHYSDTSAYISGVGNDINNVAQKQNDVNYTEGVYVGYKYFDKNNITPEFAFGHGLSYTTFSYSNLRFNTSSMGPNDTITASVDITNTGTRAGQEIAQLYIHQNNPSIDRPVKELKGYQKVSLNAGQTQTVSFAIDKDSLSYWDINTHSFKADAGSYEAWVGAAADDIRLKSAFTLTQGTAPDPNYTVVQAESAASTTNTTTGTNTEVDGTSTSFLKLNGSNSTAKWNVTVPTAGEYSIIFRFSNNGYNGDVAASYGPNKTTALTVNGQSAGSYDFQNTRWANVYNYDSIDVNLNAGSNEIALNATASTAGLILDKMIVQKINRTLPDPAACAPDSDDEPPSQNTSEGTVYQVENATDLSGSAVSTQIPNYTGTGYVALASANSSVTFDINAPTIGTYRLNLYYSNGTSTAAPCDIYVDGQLKGTYTLAPTGGWSKWKAEQSPQMAGLNTGLHQVKVVAKTQGVNLDKAVLSGGMITLETTPPVVNSTYPVNGKTVANVAGALSVYASEVIKAGTDANNVTLTDGTSVLHCTASFSGSVMTLQPAQALNYASTYTVTIPKNTLTDESGNALANDYTFTFNTPQVQNYAATAANITYSGSGWQTSGQSKVSKTAGDSLTLWADATDIQLTLPTGPDKGIATVYVDEQQKDTGSGTSVDLYSAQSGTKVFDTGALTNGVHRVKVAVSGSKSQGSDTTVGLISVSVAGSLIAGPLSSSGWSGDAFADTAERNNTFDGNLDTRWATLDYQKSGQWYSIDFGSAIDLSAIVLYTAGGDYIRGYSVYVSNDGTNWGSPVTSGTGNSGYTTMSFPKQTCRYVKIVQTSSSASSWWSINELYVFNKPFVDSEDPTAPEYLYFTGYNNQIKVGWNGASDNVGITQYIVYRNGTEVARTANNFYIDASGLQNRNYTYSVKALDASGNVSPMSDTISAVANPSITTLPRDGWIATAFATQGTTSTSNVLDANASTRWTSGTGVASGQWFTVNMGSQFAFNRVVMDGNSTDYPGSFQILVSNDGTNWSAPVYSGAGSGGTITADFPQQIAQYIKIVNTGASRGDWWSISEFNVMNITNPALSRDAWVASASDSPAGATDNDLPRFALDGNSGTRWSSGTAQYNGMWYALDLGAASSFNKIVMDCGGSDYIRSYAVYTSDNGTSWSSTPVATGTCSSNPVTITFPQVSTRYVKIVDTGSTTQSWWGIFEINLYNDAPATNKTDLQIAVNRTLTLQAGDYTTTSWSALQTALTAANGVLADTSAAQNAVDTSTTNLTTAINQLTPMQVADKTALAGAISQVNGLNAANYTAASWSDLQNALIAANSVYVDASATQGAVNTAAQALTTAIQNLVEAAPQVNKTALNAAITQADGLTESDYTTASWSALQTALTAAKAVQADSSATQAAVDTAAQNLTAAIQNLVEKPVVTKTALNAAVSQANALTESDYTDASWSALRTALTAAKATQADSSATQAAVDTAAQNLTAAIQNLVEKPVVTKTALNAAVSQANALTEADYTAASWSALKAALTAAKAVQADSSATQAVVDTAAQNLTTAIQNLVEAAPQVSKTALNTAVAQANGLKEADYTAASWSALQTALKAAQDINADTSASQKDVDDAAKALGDAIKALVSTTGTSSQENSSPSSQSNPGTSSGSSSTSSGQGTGSSPVQSPNTGDRVPLLLLLFTTAASAGTAIAMKLKKRFAK